MWAERERGMMRLFLEDLRHYTQLPRASGDAAHYAHITELTVRLHFLTAIFSPVGSPQHFRYGKMAVLPGWPQNECLAAFPWVISGISHIAYKRIARIFVLEMKV